MNNLKPCFQTLFTPKLFSCYLTRGFPGFVPEIWFGKADVLCGRTWCFGSIERSLAGTRSNVDFRSMGSEQASLFLRLEEGLSFSYVMWNDEMLACECMIIISMKTILEISNFYVSS